jgi:hypothetical protein
MVAQVSLPLLIKPLHPWNTILMNSVSPNGPQKPHLKYHQHLTWGIMFLGSRLLGVGVIGLGAGTWTMLSCAEYWGGVQRDWEGQRMEREQN